MSKSPYLSASGISIQINEPLILFRGAKLIRLASSVSLFISLTGCGMISAVKSFSTPYATPEGVETARLRIITDGMVRGIPNSDCIDFRLPGAGVMVVARDGYANRNAESLGMPPSSYSEAPGARSELLIAAGQPIAFHYNGNRCYNMFTFVPAAGVDYELKASDGPICSVTILRSTPNSSKKSYEPLKDSKLCRVLDNL
ncbi:hypothetical protein AO070_04760 [Pseudomonas syringae pv. syringae PD2766]|uniref:hypothetical protein n=1 Tax=Pseudomonas syringae TaxID=317 RepID=UPI000736FAD8|nr:hypothetical protein [Pseudomonas syringae]KTB87926.1 hypothetical protein AO070_04760 [Pseudomonas syringae pv. syringae PD2766]